MVLTAVVLARPGSLVASGAIAASWFETRSVAALLTMRISGLILRRRESAVSKDVPRNGSLHIHLRVLATHCARGLHLGLPLEIRGRREDRVHAAPAVSRANCANKNAHEHTGSAETLRPSLRNGFTAYNVISPENGSFASVVAQDNPAQLDASTAASGPHDFTVRSRRVRLAPLASIASHRTFVTIAKRPSSAVRRAELCR